ncbi:MAG TPA: hypothetical protein ACQGQH_02300 [Xylella sp.]
MQGGLFGITEVYDRGASAYTPIHAWSGLYGVVIANVIEVCIFMTGRELDRQSTPSSTQNPLY